MTIGLTAMNGGYGNFYGMQNYYNNPYFLQAFNSPNYNQMYGQQQVYGQQNLANAGMTNAQVTTPTTGTGNVSFNGAQNSITEKTKKEKGSNGLAWALGIGATAIGTAWWLASRGKARNATGLWNQIKTGFTSLFNKPTVIKGVEQITKNKDTLKINEALKWTDEAANLRRFQFDLKDADGVVQKFAYNNGEITTKAYKDGKLSDALKKQVDDIVEIIKGKDISKLSPDVTLKNIQYTANLENGIGLYRALTPDAVDNLQFVRAQL